MPIDPPADGRLTAPGDSRYRHAAACWLTEISREPTVTADDRAAGSAFAATLKFTVAAPWPEPDVSVIHDAPAAADQVHSASVEIVSRPSPPSGGNEAGAAFASTLHFSKALGPTDVLDEDPHAELSRSAAAPAVVTRRTQQCPMRSIAATWSAISFQSSSRPADLLQKACAIQLMR
jgi:hypothetical protein